MSIEDPRELGIHFASRNETLRKFSLQSRSLSGLNRNQITCLAGGVFVDKGYSSLVASHAATEELEASVQRWCINYLAKSLNVPGKLIDPNAKFARLGVDSASSIFFLMDLEEWLAIELPANLVFEYPTVAQLARYIARHFNNEAARGRG